MDGAASVASCIYTNGTGTRTLQFTKGTTYGNTTYRFYNKTTLEYDEVNIYNLGLSVPGEDIGIPGDGGSFTESGLAAYGGDASWVVKSMSSWITSASNIGGELHFTAAAEPNELDRTGFITIAHVNDSNYTKTIKINQSAKFVKFPEFDFLVVRYRVGDNQTGGSWDMDSGTFFKETGISDLDDKGVGFGAYSDGGIEPIVYQNLALMSFGGDNSSSGYETAFVNFLNLRNAAIYDALPRYFNINLYARWFSGIKGYPIYIDIILYKGGTMSSVNTYDFKNEGGIIQLQETYSVPLNVMSTKTPIAPNNYNSSQSIGTIRYDKMKNTATFTLNPAPASLRSVINNIEYLPGETKEEYGIRLSKNRK